MQAAEIKALGEAISQNADLISDLDFVELDPVYQPNAPRSAGLLKNARIIEEVEDDFFYPGENFELIKKAIGTNRHVESAPISIEKWFEGLRLTIEDYYESLVGDDGEEGVFKRQVYRHVRAIEGKLNSSIRAIDYQVSSEFGHHKTIEAKLRRSQDLLGSTQQTLEELARLTFKAFSSLAIMPNADLDRVFIELDRKLNKLRANLRAVITKIQKLNISFRKVEARTKRISRIFNAIQNKEVDLNVEYIDVAESLNELCKVESAGVVPMAHFDSISPPASQETVFHALAGKLKIKGNADSQRQPVDIHIELEAEEIEVELAYPFEALLNEEKMRFASRLRTHINKPLSLRTYWESNESLSSLIDIRAWLFEMIQWCSEVYTDDIEYQFNYKVVSEPVCHQAETLLISDVVASLYEQDHEYV